MAEKTIAKRVEIFLENLLFSSRWLLAPFVGAVLVGNLDHYFMNPAFPHMVALFWLYAGLLAASARLAASPASAD